MVIFDNLTNEEMFNLNRTLTPDRIEDLLHKEYLLDEVIHKIKSAQASKDWEEVNSAITLVEPTECQ